MSSMASSVKRSEVEQFSRAVGTVAGAVQGLVECTAQAAYLVSLTVVKIASEIPVIHHQTENTSSYKQKTIRFAYRRLLLTSNV